MLTPDAPQSTPETPMEVVERFKTATLTPDVGELARTNFSHEEWRMTVARLYRDPNEWDEEGLRRYPKSVYYNQKDITPLLVESCKRSGLDGLKFAFVREALKHNTLAAFAETFPVYFERILAFQ